MGAPVAVLTVFTVLAIGASTAHAGLAADEGNRLFLQEAQTGTLTPSSGGSLLLVLKNPSARVISFTDRPERRAGSEPVKTFVSKWTSRFASSAPNAAIELADRGNHEDVLVVTLEKPTFDAKAKTVTYRVKRLTGKGTAGLTDFINRRDKRLPRSFGHVSLFIDPSSGNPIQVSLRVTTPTADAAVFAMVNVTADLLVSSSVTTPANIDVAGKVVAIGFQNPVTPPGTVNVSFNIFEAVTSVRINVQALPAGASVTGQAGQGAAVTRTTLGTMSLPVS
jgi:hypothetical protein